MGKSGSVPQTSGMGPARAVRIQTATYGQVVPIVYGEARVAGNIIWAGGFFARPLNQPSGAKKGGRVGMMQYEYFVNAILALCEGPIEGLGRAYLGPQPKDDPSAPVEGRPEGAPPLNSNQDESCWRNKRVVAVTDTQKRPTAGFWQFGPKPMVLGTVPATIPTTGSGSDETRAMTDFDGASVLVTYHADATADAIWDILKKVDTNGRFKFRFLPPGTEEAAWPEPERHQGLAYPGVAYVAGHELHLDSNASLPTYNFNLRGLQSYLTRWQQLLDVEVQQVLKSNQWKKDDNYVPYIRDALAADIAYDLLTNTRYGAGWPASQVGELYTGANTFAAYCRAHGIWFSPVYDQQRTAADILSELCDLANTALVWSEGRLKFVPYGDEAATSTLTGVAYDPTVEASRDGAYIGVRYHLTDDDFLAQGSDDPIEVERTPPTDIYTQTSIEFLNRAMGYRSEVAEATDAAGIAAEGGAVRAEQTTQAHMICSPTLARDTAQRRLQRQLAVRNTYRFRLGWRFCLLEPMDVVTLTDVGLGLAQWPVRITGITENEGGDFDVEAEDLPIGAATVARYGQQGTTLGGIDFNETPGATHLPTVFEPIFPLVREPELWIAATGNPSIWGGAAVFLAEGSDDDYQLVDTIEGRGCVGYLLDPLPLVDGDDTTSSVRVLVIDGGSLTGATQGEAEALRRLLYVGHGNTYELVSFSTVTLLATNGPHSVYRLDGYFRRGVYATAPLAHNAGTPLCYPAAGPFARVALPTRLIGRDIFVKVVPYNVYGATPLGLEDVEPITHHVDGTWWLAAPGDVTGAHGTLLDGYVQLAWSRVEDPRSDNLEYEVRVGSTWASGTILGRTRELSFVVRGPGTYWIAARVSVATGLRTARAYSEVPAEVLVTEGTATVDFFREADLDAQRWPGTTDPYPLAVWALEPQWYVRFADPGDLTRDSGGYFRHGGDDVVILGGGSPSPTALRPVYEPWNAGALACDGTAAAVTVAASRAGELLRYLDGWTTHVLVQRGRTNVVGGEVLVEAMPASGPGWRVKILQDGKVRIDDGPTPSATADSATAVLNDTAPHLVAVTAAVDTNAIPLLGAGTAFATIEVRVDGVQVAVWIGITHTAAPQTWGGSVAGLGAGENHFVGVLAELALHTPYLPEDPQLGLVAARTAAKTGGLVIDPLAGTLRLGGTTLFDDLADVDAAITIDYAGGVARSGTYYPDQSIAAQILAAKTTVRPYAVADLVPLLPYATFDDLPDVDSEAAIDTADPDMVAGTLAFSIGRTPRAEARLEEDARLAEVCPYEPFAPYRAGVLEAQRIRWRYTVTTDVANAAAAVEGLLVGTDALPRTESGHDVPVGAPTARLLGTATLPNVSPAVATVTLPQAVPSGALLLVGVAASLGPAATIDVTDSAGGTYTVPQLVRGGNLAIPSTACAVRLLGTALPAGTVITVTLAGQTTGIGAVTVAAIQGVSSATPDKTVAVGPLTIKAGTQTLSTGSSGTLAQANEVCVALFGVRCAGGDPYVPLKGVELLQAGTVGVANGALDVSLMGQALAVASTAAVTLTGLLTSPGARGLTGVLHTFRVTPVVGTRVTFARPFNTPPSVQVAVRDAAAGDQVLITSIDTGGFTVRVVNGGTEQLRAVDWTASGD